jgi:hypothetical protein
MLMSQNNGGRGRTKSVVALERNLDRIEKMLDDPDVPAQVKGRLLQEQAETLRQERAFEITQRNDKHEELIAEQAHTIASLKVELEAKGQTDPALPRVDPVLEQQLARTDANFRAAESRIHALEVELAAVKHNTEREISLLKKENEELRSDAEFGARCVRNAGSMSCAS